MNGERNGKGKEYKEFDQIEFEGDYLNGKRNGKGKEYNYSIIKIICDRENLKEERNGQGKEYNYYNGKLIFEGEYLNGLKILGIKG